VPICHAIIAPHYDDEIIGCYGVLARARSSGLYVVVLYAGQSCEMGGHLVEDLFGVTTDKIRRTQDVLSVCSDTGVPVRLYAPDPYYEHHPEHKRWGQIAEQLFRDRQVQELVFYVTRMNAPYIFEVSKPQDKRSALDACYPEKSDLWRNDHRFFLFEGRCQWLDPNRV